MGVSIGSQQRVVSNAVPSIRWNAVEQGSPPIYTGTITTPIPPANASQANNTDQLANDQRALCMQFAAPERNAFYTEAGVVTTVDATGERQTAYMGTCTLTPQQSLTRPGQSENNEPSQQPWERRYKPTVIDDGKFPKKLHLPPGLTEQDLILPSPEMDGL
jgi:hypothetical protein